MILCRTPYASYATRKSTTWLRFWEIFCLWDLTGDAIERWPLGLGCSGLSLPAPSDTLSCPPYAGHVTCESTTWLHLGQDLVYIGDAIERWLLRLRCSDLSLSATLSILTSSNPAAPERRADRARADLIYRDTEAACRRF